MALDFKCSADLKCINAVYEEGQEKKKKPPSQCKQAVAQSSETIRTKNLSYLEKKHKGTAQTLQTFTNPHFFENYYQIWKKGLGFPLPILHTKG